MRGPSAGQASREPCYPEGVFREALARGPLVADGAMGTELHRRGFPFTVRYEELNLSHPEVVREIHAAYAAAGATVHTTNTFGLTRDTRDLRAIARAAVSLIPSGFIAGSIGPGEALAEVADALAEAGVHVLQIETMTDRRMLMRAIDVAKRTGLPVIAHATTREDVFAEMLDRGADVIGINCLSPDEIDTVLDRVLAVSDRVSLRPSAGLPPYDVTPERFLRVPRVAIRGGCCGSTPLHIAALAHAS